MKRESFVYHLPEHLIAHFPPPERTSSRLMMLDGASGDLYHQHFSDLLAQFQPGDLVVFNNTRVIPARLFGNKASGGKVEVLVERLLDAQQCLAHVKASKSPKAGSDIFLEDGVTPLRVIGRQGDLFVLSSEHKPLMDILEQVGHIPLPPYIERADEAADRERYQTVYNSTPGAVAAPTAGLHFDEPFMASMAAKGVDIHYVTLHVGAGTFQPVRVDNIEEHQMHSEWLSVSQAVCDAINQAKAENRRVIAVGTTSVRCLETIAQAAQGQPLQAYEGDTNIFIYPGYRFQLVDALVTNFHLPESTLLMLVSAFAGYSNTLNAYREAVKQEYRFFSYGDAMFITRNPQAPNETMS